MSSSSSAITIPEPLSAKYKNSFAFKTLTYRLPVIITKIIDLLCRRREHLIQQQLNLVDQSEEHRKSEASEEIKLLIEKLAKIKYELVTNKAINPLEKSSRSLSILADIDDWNESIRYEQQRLNKNEDETITYFETSWLLSECYIYRVIYEIFIESKYFQKFDPFAAIKCDSFQLCLNSATNLARQLLSLINEDHDNHVDQELFFKYFTMNSLWGNKFDLSLSCGDTATEISQNDGRQLVETGENRANDNGDIGDQSNIMEKFSKFEKKIIRNDLNRFWSYVRQLSVNVSNDQSKKRIDVILDNAGYELFTDLCWLVAMNHLDLLPNEHFQIYLHVKCIPWFVSDTLVADIDWLLNFLRNEPNLDENLRKIGQIFTENLANQHWKIVENKFWTLADDYSRMPQKAPELFETFSNQSDLLLFKGDLNYRKLVGDLRWPLRTKFGDALRQFRPKSPAICSLRTIKADVVVDIEDEETLKQIDQKINGFNDDWMEIGEFAVINFWKF